MSDQAICLKPAVDNAPRDFRTELKTACQKFKDALEEAEPEKLEKISKIIGGKYYYSLFN
jgi:hypothetical protein